MRRIGLVAVVFAVGLATIGTAHGEAVNGIVGTRGTWVRNADGSVDGQFQIRLVGQFRFGGVVRRGLVAGQASYHASDIGELTVYPFMLTSDKPPGPPLRLDCDGYEFDYFQGILPELDSVILLLDPSMWCMGRVGDGPSELRRMIWTIGRESQATNLYGCLPPCTSGGWVDVGTFQLQT